MLQFTKGYIQKKGGKVLGEEYLPMDGSDWTAIIGKLKAAKPDALITSTAGGAPNVTLTKQLRAAGITIPYGNLAVDEGTAKSMGPDAEGIFISGSYFTNIDSPKNKEFLAAMQKKFGADLKTPNDLSVPRVRGRVPLQGGGGEGGLDGRGQGHRGPVHSVIRRTARHDQDEQAAPRAAHHVPRSGPEGRQHQGSGDVPERGPRRPVP